MANSTKYINDRAKNTQFGETEIFKRHYILNLKNVQYLPFNFLKALDDIVFDKSF
jgi:hypothetical protein